MAERLRNREPETRVNVTIDDSLRGDRDDISLAERMIMETDENDEETVSIANSPEQLFTPPQWLKGLFSIQWSRAESRKKTAHRGRNCCLFYPLGYSAETDVINGFCVFHLRAVFNLVYQTDCVYQMNAQNKPVMSQRTACFVAEPQPVNDEYTAIFPVMELMHDEIQLKDIKLHNMSKHLQLSGNQNWERIYAHHVNYLYRLCTLYSPHQMAQRPIETRSDQVSATQLMMHWNLWNEYHSKLLHDYPADINVFYISADKDNDVVTVPIKLCTTVTQMIARFFAEPYTDLNERRFFSMVAPYGIYAHAHWSYANNLCSIGTHCTKGNLPCIGNAALLSMLRSSNGSCRGKTLHYARMDACKDDLCVPALLNRNAPSLNRTVVVSTKHGPVSTGPTT